MDTLRRSRRTASLMLAWFFAFLVVAGAAPLLKEQSFSELCTTAGVVQVAAQDGGDGDADRHAAHPLECALCAGISGPPVTLAAMPTTDAPLAHALLPLVSAELASLTSAPLPARGPPSLS